MTLRLLGVMALVLTASVGAVSALSGVSPTRLLGLVAVGGVPPGANAVPHKGGAGGAVIPMYSDGWSDDSGIAIATDFEAPVPDPASLAEVAAARRGGAARGIARFEQELARLGHPRSDQEAL